MDQWTKEFDALWERIDHSHHASLQYVFNPHSGTGYESVVYQLHPKLSPVTLSLFHTLQSNTNLPPHNCEVKFRVTVKLRPWYLSFSPRKKLFVISKRSISEAPVITTFPSHTKSEVFYVGMTINLVCMAKGRPVPQVQWFKDESDQPLQKSSGSILHHIKSASKEDSGRYTCLASNQAGKVIRSIEYIILRKYH
jgi:hypothetical protein